MAQGQLLGLLQGLIFCWDFLEELLIDPSGEGFRKDSCRQTAYGVVWEGILYVAVGVCK